MNNSITLLNKSTGRTVTGYTCAIYTYLNESPYYQNPKLYDFTDNGDGTYTANVTESIRGTVLITSPSAETKVPANYINHWFEGDNQLTEEPT